MNIFFTFLQMGFDHISDLRGYDHILFIVTLCSVYTWRDWRKITILVTAFTIGHSVTLALAALKIIIPNPDLVEVLIPVTILVTALVNIYSRRTSRKDKVFHSYWLALTFGFIHGLGFSSFFNAIMSGSIDIVFPLFAFNVGLELGQLLIVATFLLVTFIILRLSILQEKWWLAACSVSGAILSVIMIFSRL
jgi:hypothetical protein